MKAFVWEVAGRAPANPEIVKAALKKGGLAFAIKLIEASLMGPLQAFTKFVTTLEQKVKDKLLELFSPKILEHHKDKFTENLIQAAGG